MSWIQKLYETYERCVGREPPGSEPLMPVGHTTQQAHIEIVIDGEGNFRRAAVIPKGQQTTLIPCTEQSASRGGTKPVHHPLCDSLQYVAGDFIAYGGEVTSGFAKDPHVPHSMYVETLEKWVAARESHAKVRAILIYVRCGHVIQDLVGAKILPTTNGPDGTPVLLKEWPGNNEDAPEIFRAIPRGQAPENAFVRWRVESANTVETGTWEDRTLFDSWTHFECHLRTKAGLCMVTGRNDVNVAEQHPAKLRHAADKAKLISSNDTSGFTFRGRFTDAAQAAGVSYEVTQKAHNALRWLIGRKQAFRNGDQVLVSWAVGGHEIPDPWLNSRDLFGIDGGTSEASDSAVHSAPGDVGQSFSLRLNKAIAGYRATLDDNESIVVMGLDSATPGRMAITFYRELKGSEFLQRIEKWHVTVSWLQNFGKHSSFIGAPAPRDIAEAAYGRRLDDKLRKTVVERLLPCIIDGERLPRDLVESCGRRAFNRVGLEPWEWEKCLGIACAFYKGFHDERRYRMSLEEDRTTRDYLYGRLLAVAEHIESRALYVAGEKRDTMAARLMQRFADRPCSTWRTISLSLVPYKARLRASRPGFLWEMEQLLDALMATFSTQNHEEAFTNDRPLTAEFLLGYHCQRQRLREKAETKTEADVEPDETDAT